MPQLHRHLSLLLQLRPKTTPRCLIVKQKKRNYGIQLFKSQVQINTRMGYHKATELRPEAIIINTNEARLRAGDRHSNIVIEVRKVRTVYISMSMRLHEAIRMITRQIKKANNNLSHVLKFISTNVTR